ncbi:MAG: hypothetical protein DDG59_13065 [Anaerolineae bacterium]|jgi:hypothetical protein|nr:MAG: hypothetical protein DDG59_13065 [Anaerolineae bacterium]
MRLLPELSKGHLYLLLAPRAIQRPLLNEFIARLALRGEVQVLVCGNRFHTHEIARRLRHHTEAFEAALGRLRLARAFTIYQVLALLRCQRDTRLPSLVTDLPDLFCDESVPQAERLRLFQDCLAELKHLSSNAPTLVSASPADLPLQGHLLHLLQAAAQTLWEIERPSRPAFQSRLF